jgi:hypothetical protein
MGTELDIEAEIENLQYYPQLTKELEVFGRGDIKSGVAFRNASFLLKYEGKTFAVSHWRTSKRTRTYPYARVYDTMSHQTRVTIIPFVTDEGLQGDHDFMQWDTVSLMSLLGIFVIPVYYRSAVKNPKFKNKITQQRFDYDYLLERLDALAHYNQADAYHWNVNEIRTQLPIVAQRAKSFYAKISKQTGVQMHAMRGG